MCIRDRRNMVCFNNTTSIPSDKPKFLIERFHETEAALNMEAIRNGELKEGKCQVYVGWEQPPEGWVLLNTDGASRRNPGPAGGGGVVSGRMDMWLCRRTGSLYIDES